MVIGDSQRPIHCIVHDRDDKFGGGFDEIFRSEEMTVIRTPIRAPNANADAERWVRTLRGECLDRIPIFGRRQLEHAIHVYTSHHRPHRALSLRPPEQAQSTSTRLRAPADEQVRRRDLLGGLHEYQLAA